MSDEDIEYFRKNLHAVLGLPADKEPPVVHVTVEEFLKLHGGKMPSTPPLPVFAPERILGVERVCPTCGGSYKPENERLRHACECGKRP